MAIKSPEDARDLNKVKWAQHNAERIEARIQHLVEHAPPLTDAQRARLAKIIGIEPADTRQQRDKVAELIDGLREFYPEISRDDAPVA